MIPFVLAAAFGINVTANVVHFVSDKISEKESGNRKQILEKANGINDRTDKKIHEKHQAFLKEIENVKNSLSAADKAETEKYIQQLKKEYDEQEMQSRRLSSERRRYFDEKNTALSSAVIKIQEKYDSELEDIYTEYGQNLNELLDKDVEEHIRYTEELIHDIDENIKTLANFNEQHLTNLRKNSLQMIKEEFRIIKNKAFAYKEYLKQYKKRLSFICSNSSDDVLYSLTLPADYPYRGKLLFLNSDEVLDAEGIIKFTFHNAIDVKIKVTDIDSEEKLSLMKPLYIDGFDTEFFYHKASVELGSYYYFKRNGGYSGILAKVKEYSLKEHEIILQFGSNTTLHLNERNLLNANHYPPVGAELMVYPLREFYDKTTEKLNLYVSQREEDTEISLAFKSIPVVIPDDKIISFCEYFVSHNIDKTFDDSKIAPLNSDEIDTSMFRIQFQDKFLIAVKVKTRQNVQYFEFDSILTEEKTIGVDEIFVSFNAVIKMYSEDEFVSEIQNDSSNEISDGFNNLLISVFKELKIQLEIKNSKDGIKYYTVWEQIIKKLHNYLTYGTEFRFITENLPEKRIDWKTKDVKFRFYTSENEKLKEYRTKAETENGLGFRCSFFTEYEGMKLNVNIPPTYEYIEIVFPVLYFKKYENNIDEFLLSEGFTIYKEEFAVPELRQRIALYHFRAGHFANERLHSFALNAENVITEQESIEDTALTLCNEKLKEDESQFNALYSALKEKNWFMIQGPPGTGKTTVIRELIWQTLSFNPNAKILIVSQANVAVDNVLRGVLNAGISSEIVIRCGRKEKIAEDILGVSYEQKYDDYQAALEKQRKEGNIISECWYEMLERSSQRNSDIGELFIRSHQIIGATCVGLAQKNIGLENTSFDLVIIDEAGKALASEIVIPLIKAKKVVMIGDHMQLPPVINPVLYDSELIELDDRPYVSNELFEHSLFEKLFKACPDTNKTILSTQYRMPELVGSLVSSIFYDNAVKNGINTKHKEPVFFDNSLNLIDMSKISDYHENDSGGSPYNDYEALYVVWLSKQIRQKNQNAKIAVITPYKGQKRKIINSFESNKIDIQKNKIVIDTVDAFQGDEAELVIYCTTRSKRKTAFYSDFRRLNVAFSRAKNELIILASVKYLEKYDSKEYIHRVLEFIKQNKCIRLPEKIK